MLVSDFHFDLPEDLIAQSPPEPRGSSRMLVLDRTSGQRTDDHFANVASYLDEGDLVLLNDSRVIPARLFAVRAGLHTQPGSPEPRGRIEILLTQQVCKDQWRVLVRPSRKVVVGERLLFHAAGEPVPVLEAEVVDAGEFGERTLQFRPATDFYGTLDRIGRIPLPPYIHRQANQEDRHRYQTVFAGQPGSAAAPTAGLHFTPDILASLKAKGVVVETITLHVGLGTFQPVRVDRLEDIRLHEESYLISQTAADAICVATHDKKRIVAIGTTTARTLEGSFAARKRLSVAPIDGGFEAHNGATSIFISPGFRFEVVTGLLTNFHLPQSTLLMLVSAFAGQDAVLAAYAYAVQQRYRFFSYGDCMLIL